MTNTTAAKATELIDFPALARKIYELDPDWSWQGQRQVFTPFEKLPAQRVLELVQAAQGIAAFSNAFQRDIPLSGLVEVFNQANRFKATVDMES